MAYSNPKEMLKKAYENKYAVGHFNVLNLIWAKKLLEICEEERAPVILGASEGAIRFIGGYNAVAHSVKSLISDMKITIPVALHLDHGSSFESCEKAIYAGFTSVMIDKSALPLDENISITKKVVELAKIHNVAVEAEVGLVGGEEGGPDKQVLYAKFEDCKKMVNSVDLTCFAPALGSVHGHYKGEPKLGFDEMEKISKELRIPLVLHGASGIPEWQVKKAIAKGIAKVNMSTDFQDAYCAGLRDYFDKNLDRKPKGYDPRKHENYAFSFMKKLVVKKNTHVRSK